MMICGACESELPEDSYGEEQRGRRQSIRRCEECVAAGNQLVLMKKGRKRSEEDDCPICNLPLPFRMEHLAPMICCMKKLCHGCFVAARRRGMSKCPFCRTPTPYKRDMSRIVAMIRKRVDAGDPLAMHYLGSMYQTGVSGLEKDVTRVVELWERAAELGLNEAHHNLGRLYREGIDVEKDTTKAFRHYEAAAVGGDVSARLDLGCMEQRAGNDDIAVQHWMIAAKLGHETALDYVKKMFMLGEATKADYAAALRGYQSAAQQMRSPDRDEVDKLIRVSEQNNCFGQLEHVLGT